MTKDMNSVKDKYNMKWKRRERVRVVLFLAFVSFVLGLIFALYSPVFNIQSIDVIGQNKFSKDEIIRMSYIQRGSNIFKLNASQAVERIEHDPYIESAIVKRNLPNKININIEERKPIALVPLMGSYILIDKNGIAVETKTQIEEKTLVSIKGLKFETFSLGKPIVEGNSKNLKVALAILTMIQEDVLLVKDLLAKMDYINVSNLDEITMYIDKRFDVKLGSASELESSGLCKYRLELLRSILVKNLKDDIGEIYLIGDKPRFVPKGENYN